MHENAVDRGEDSRFFLRRGFLRAIWLMSTTLIGCTSWRDLNVTECRSVVDKFQFGIFTDEFQDQIISRHNPTEHVETEREFELYRWCIDSLRRPHRAKEYLPEGTIALPGRDYPTVLVKLPTTGTLFMVPAFDLVVGAFAKFTGTFDLQEEYFLQRIVQKGDVVIELGANIGVYTIALANAVGPTGLVYAFEPFRQIFHILNANVALHGLGNVITRQIGVHRENSFQHVRAPYLGDYTNLGAIRVFLQQATDLANVPYNGTEIIEVKSLDSLDLECAHVMKIDVEGMELEVALGGEAYIKRCQPLLYVENQGYVHDDRRFADYMETIGYYCQLVKALQIHDIVVCFSQGDKREADHRERIRNVFFPVDGEGQPSNYKWFPNSMKKLI